MTLGGCGANGGDQVDVVAETSVNCEAAYSNIRMTSDEMGPAELKVRLEARVAASAIDDPCAVQIRLRDGSVEVGVGDPGDLALVTASGEVTFHEVLDEVPAAVSTDEADGLTPGADGTRYRLGTRLNTTNIVADASANVSGDGMWTVSVTFTEAGAIEFDAIAAKLYQQRLAIATDGKVLSAPTLQERRFGGRAEISGNFSADEARSLSAALDNPLVGNITVENVPPS